MFLLNNNYLHNITASENSNIAYRAFDGEIDASFNVNSWYTSNTFGIPNVYLEFETLKKTRINKLSIWGRDGSSTINQFSLRGYDNDTGTWITLLEDNLENNNTMQDFMFNNPTYFETYRVYVESIHGGNHISCHSIEVHGVLKEDYVMTLGALERKSNTAQPLEVNEKNRLLIGQNNNTILSLEDEGWGTSQKKIINIDGADLISPISVALAFKEGMSLLFEGNGESGVISGVTEETNNTPFSIKTKVKIDDVSLGTRLAPQQILHCRGASGWASHRWSLNYNTTDGINISVFPEGGSNQHSYVRATIPAHQISQGVFYEVEAICVPNDKLQIFLNNTLVNETDISGSNNFLATSGLDYMVSRKTSGGNTTDENFVGEIAELVFELDGTKLFDLDIENKSDNIVPDKEENYNLTVTSQTTLTFFTTDDIDVSVYFEIEAFPNIFLPLKDAYGEKIEIQVNTQDKGVYGVFQNIGRYNGTRLVLEASSVVSSNIYVKVQEVL